MAFDKYGDFNPNFLFLAQIPNKSVGVYVHNNIFQCIFLKSMILSENY